MTSPTPFETFTVFCAASGAVAAIASRIRSMLTKKFVVLALLLTILMVAAVARGQETAYSASFTTNKEPIAINVLVGQSRLITFDRALERFSVSNPDIAEAVLVSANQVVINGKAFGQINLIAWEKSSARFIVFDVYVRTNLSLIDCFQFNFFPYTAPVGLIWGFKKGDEAVIEVGTQLAAAVKKNQEVAGVPTERKPIYHPVTSLRPNNPSQTPGLRGTGKQSFRPTSIKH